MKNLFLFCCLFCVSHAAFAQLIVSTNNVEHWQWTNGFLCNLHPASSDQLNGLTGWRAVESDCTGPTFANEITAGNCYANNKASVFFKTNFTLPHNTVPCFASYFATGDNFFRVYINGVQAQGPYFVGDNDCSSIANWNGNDWTVGFANTISNLLIPGENTLIVELQNGISLIPPHPLWFAGNFTIWRTSDLNASFNHSLTLLHTGEYELKLAATGFGITHTWTIETSENSNGPWELLATKSNGRLGAFQYFIVPTCVWIRVTHTVYAGPCSKTETLFFRQCEGQKIEHLVTKDQIYNISSLEETGIPDFYTAPIEFSADNLQDSLKSFTAQVITDEKIEKTSSLDIFPNPTSGNISIDIKRHANEIYKVIMIDNLGRVVLESELYNGLNSFLIPNLSSGVLYVKVVDTEGAVVLAKKILVRI